MLAPILMAFQALAANKLRSVLTMLGTIIGVTCVVTLWNIGESSRRYMSDAVSSIGQNLIFISPRHGGDEEDQRRQRFRPLTVGEAIVIARDCPAVEEVSPVLFGSEKAFYGPRHLGTEVRGCFASFLRIRNWGVARGVAFCEADVNSSNRVALLGSEVARELFGELDPVGQTIRLGAVPFKVSGVLKPKGSFFGSNDDRQILVPFNTAADSLGWGRNVHMIFASARSRELVDQAKKEILMAVRKARNLALDRKDPVRVQDLGESAEMVDKVLLGATMFLGAVAAVSLLVGGIGIMNIMLVSVTERTREIGLRMAVGATDLNVLFQFLVEAMVLSGVGGVIGAGAGIGCAAAGVAILTSLTGQPWILEVSPQSVAVAIGFSACVGIFFGFYPAWRASRLDPIEALRRE